MPRQPIVSVRCWSVMMTRTLRTLLGISESYQSLQCLFVVEIEGEGAHFWVTTLSMSSSSAPLVSVRNFAVKMTARTPKAQ